jgi:AmiR/NasT family two-component response regulator
MRCDADDAFRILKSQSQAQNVKLREIAEEIVRNTTRPASPGDG